MTNPKFTHPALSMEPDNCGPSPFSDAPERLLTLWVKWTPKSSGPTKNHCKPNELDLLEPPKKILALRWSTHPSLVPTLTKK